MTDLIDAARSGSIDDVNRLLDEGVDINSRNELGHTALTTAAWSSENEIVRLLLDTGSVDVELRDMSIGHRKTFSPLMIASLHKNLELVEMLLESGADPNGNRRDKPPLFMVVDHNLKGYHHGEWVNPRQEDEEGVLNLLLEKGVDINYQMPIYMFSVLIAAVLNGSVLSGLPMTNTASSIRLLVEKGINVNLCDGRGVGALTFLINNEWPGGGAERCELVGLLLENGADPNMKDGGGKTPLTIAVKKKRDHRLILSLLENGGDLAIKDESTQTPMTPLEIAKDVGNEIIVNVIEEFEDRPLRDARKRLAFMSGTHGRLGSGSSLDQIRQLHELIDPKLRSDLREVDYTIDKGTREKEESEQMVTVPVPVIHPNKRSKIASAKKKRSKKPKIASAKNKRSKKPKIASAKKKRSKKPKIASAKKKRSKR